MTLPLNIITLILAYYLRKPLGTDSVSLYWKSFFNWVITIAIVLITVDTIWDSLAIIKLLLALLLMGAVIYIVLTFPEFHHRKSLIYAWLPIIIVEALSKITETVSPELYNTVDDYFTTAGVFAFLWGVAMWINNRKQRKALELEQLKAIEREKEFRITEAIKAKLEVQVGERTAELMRQKEELEKALEELKSTQEQLIQSEKMASLGELTAGIAHEIQNPLNFVNNFSEVSNELLQEMKEELENGNNEEAIAIVEDVIQNISKITHHGKRADSIVKGMLQHSRSGSGQKEPTDINALADEYLRLSYHGLRAKDKSFNADFKLDLDPDLPKMELYPQEIGRVLLNLINNAFYAAIDKKRMMENEKNPESAQFVPSVLVSTKSLKNGIEIRVRDNGNGIPEEIKSKIFQPFFTTKPTGKGTGLGLSMSYEIITKGHGGKLTLSTQEGEYTEFVITLIK